MQASQTAVCDPFKVVVTTSSRAAATHLHTPKFLYKIISATAQFTPLITWHGYYLEADAETYSETSIDESLEPKESSVSIDDESSMWMLVIIKMLNLDTKLWRGQEKL